MLSGGASVSHSAAPHESPAHSLPIVTGSMKTSFESKTQSSRRYRSRSSPRCFSMLALYYTNGVMIMNRHSTRLCSIKLEFLFVVQ
jgi:hypothetical protein